MNQIQFSSLKEAQNLNKEYFVHSKKGIMDDILSELSYLLSKATKTKDVFSGNILQLIHYLNYTIPSI